MEAIQLIKDKLLELFNCIGINLTDDEFDDELYLDSMQFVGILVGIEETFMLMVTEDQSNYDQLKTFNDYLRFITKEIKFYVK